VFAHGSGSSRRGTRNRAVAAGLRDRGLGTLLMDLLTADEEAVDARARELRFDIGLLAGRLEAAAAWLADQPEARDLEIGYFGAAPAPPRRWSRRPAIRRVSVRSSPAEGGPISPARTYIASRRRPCSSWVATTKP
jgi:hypothetical protein